MTHYPNNNKKNLFIKIGNQIMVHMKKYFIKNNIIHKITIKIICINSQMYFLMIIQ